MKKFVMNKITEKNAEKNTERLKSSRDPRIRNSNHERTNPNSPKSGAEPRIRDTQSSATHHSPGAHFVSSLVPPPLPPLLPPITSFPSRPLLKSTIDPPPHSPAGHCLVPPPFLPPSSSAGQPFLPSSIGSQDFPSVSSSVRPPSHQLPIVPSPSENIPPSLVPAPVTHCEQIPPPPVPLFFLAPPLKPFPAQTFQPNESGNGQWAPPAPALPPFQRSRSQILEKDGSQEWVDNWIKRKGITKEEKEGQKETEPKICELKRKFDSALRLIRRLENAALTLNVMAKAVTPEEWDRKCEEVEQMKEKLTNAISQLQMTPEEMSALKVKYVKRTKKRQRLKRQAEKRKKDKEDSKVMCQNLHIHIDNWQTVMQEEVERVYRENRLVREADALLYNVTHKRAEARRQLALLASLRELRKVRDKRLVVADNPEAQLDTFNIVIDRLEAMWKERESECKLEENVMRVIVNDEIVKTNPVKRFRKLVLNEWEAAVFGAVGGAVRRPATVKIRREWDSFAVQQRGILASTIPPGYVLPVPPSDNEWRTLLKYQPSS